MKYITKKYVIKEWSELTKEEKEKEVNKAYDYLSESWSRNVLSDIDYSLEVLWQEVKSIRFVKDFYHSIDMGYSHTYFIKRIIDIEFNNPVIDIDDLDFDHNGKQLKHYDELDKNDNGGYIHLDPYSLDPRVYEILDTCGWVTFADIESVLEFDKSLKEVYESFKNDYDTFVDEINSILKLYDDIDNIPDDFIDENMETTEYEFFIDSEVTQ